VRRSSGTTTPKPHKRTIINLFCYTCEKKKLEICEKKGGLSYYFSEEDEDDDYCRKRWKGYSSDRPFSLHYFLDLPQKNVPILMMLMMMNLSNK